MNTVDSIVADNLSIFLVVGRKKEKWVRNSIYVKEIRNLNFELPINHLHNKNTENFIELT